MVILCGRRKKKAVRACDVGDRLVFAPQFRSKVDMDLTALRLPLEQRPDAPSFLAYRSAEPLLAKLRIREFETVLVHAFVQILFVRQLIGQGESAFEPRWSSLARIVK